MKLLDGDCVFVVYPDNAVVGKGRTVTWEFTNECGEVKKVKIKEKVRPRYPAQHGSAIKDENPLDLKDCKAVADLHPVEPRGAVLPITCKILSTATGRVYKYGIDGRHMPDHDPEIDVRPPDGRPSPRPGPPPHRP
jgi:hypothetical protein